MQYFAIGGLERMVERLSVACRRRGVDSLVIAYLGDGPIRGALERQGVQTVLLPGAAGLDPRLSWRIRAILMREGVDVLHTHHLGPFVYGAPAALLAGCRHVHTEHSHELYDTARRRLLGAMMSPLAEVVAVTSEVSEYRRRFPGRCSVIPNGVVVPSDDPLRRERARDQLGLDSSAFVVGCAARLSPEKNHAVLLEAFARLRRQEPRAVLLCAGEGPLGDQLRALTQEANLESHVRWLGAIDDMSAFYAALDVCTLSSDREGLPLSLLEAMSFGVPVVATEVGGIPELLDDDAGIVVPPGDPNTLVEALSSLASNPGVARSLGSRGAARIRETYSIERTADRYVELYGALAKRRVQPSDIGSVPCL
ncbi:MAG: glycosyltransferase [Polyangiales bacterium]